MTLDQQTFTTVVAVLAVLVVVLLLWVVRLERSHADLRRRLRRVLAGSEGTLDDTLEAQLRRLEQVSGRVDAVNALHHELEAIVRRTIQKVGVVRFSPFPDTGGDQSFAIALLDPQGNGIVVSSLQGRNESRLFAKQVSAGRSRHALSEEEQEAIRKALASPDSDR